MKKIKRYLTAVSAALAAAVCLTSCDEFPPVNYDDPEPSKVYTDADFPGVEFTSIADLKAMYDKGALDIYGDIWLKAQVVSSDRQGNLYRTMYIQDETGGIELKMGTRNLYNEYKMGQWVYVSCNGLTLGNYNGMLQLGYRSSDASYETSYLDSQYIIDTHIFRGAVDSIDPQVIPYSSISSSRWLGCYVTVEDVVYGNAIFAIIYDDNDGSLYLSSGTYGVDTWAINETGFARYMEDGFDGLIPESEREKYSPSSYSVSQYFYDSGSNRTALQVRTSGYARFADTKIDSRILDGSRCSLTGILTVYNSNIQFILNDLDGVVVGD